jgi:hypothetical protein
MACQFCFLLFAIFSYLTLTASFMGDDTAERYCGWELMQDLGSFPFRCLLPSLIHLSNTLVDIPISSLGNWYAEQTGDRSMCTPSRPIHLEQQVMNGKRLGKDGVGKEQKYCTCVFQCGNGVWRHEGKDTWTFEKGCKKYCHAGQCDSQGA